MNRSDVERLAQIARQQWADSRGAAHGARIRAMCSEIWDLCEAVLGVVERPDRDSPWDSAGSGEREAKDRESQP
jgi:hypothetical protein